MTELMLDVECYPNYFLVMLMTPEGKTISFERNQERTKDFNPERLLMLISHPDVRVVTFNGNDYDLPMVMYAATGADTAQLKKVSDTIIQTNLKGWQFYDEFNITRPDFITHLDLIEVAPGQASLKIYMGRMHADKLQDLPYHPDQYLTDNEQYLTKLYCKNDLRGTRMLRDVLDEQVKLRETMSEQYGIDLLSKSDAQIAEAVLRQEYYRATGNTAKKPYLLYNSFQYEPPKYIKFVTPVLKDALKVITDQTFFIKENGHVELPEAVDDLLIEIGNTVYKMGNGGLHSQESEVAHYADEDTLLIDRDVASYYPNLILNMDIAPPGFGDTFGVIYRNILNKRMEAKHSGDKVVADSLKITLNGTFGKLANPYSRLYTPKEMLRTTVTGQLSLLMLIEMLEQLRIPVVSANTDGVVIKCPKDRYDTLNKVIVAWERRTGLETEETRYKALYSRDVNSYIAVKMNGDVKCKGAYAKSGLSKSPQCEVIQEAVVAYLQYGTDPMETITQCDDVRRFVSLRTVRGGAVWQGKKLGKAVRWYYAKTGGEEIRYVTTNNTVPKTFGCKPLMQLPKTMPEDVDHEWYYREAKKTLWDLGALPRPQLEKIPRKNSKAWKALRDEGKIVEGDRGKWEWNEEIQHAAEISTGSVPVVVQQAEVV